MDNEKDIPAGQRITGAVLVVGGGIAGMQSALDLANSGFKVYLVEESTSIGGRMAQMDKTFPTNDCSMCMISPKLIEVEKHANIELLTNSRVETVEGEEGNFQISITKKPRYIDEAKCSGCGDCIEACPVSLPNEFEQGLNARKAVFKRYPQATPNAVAISKTNRPPCKLSCPAGCNGQGYIALISQGKYAAADSHIKQWIPLPAALGRICHHPCEQECNRDRVDAPVAIAPLKRFVADTVRQQREQGTVPPEETFNIDSSKPKVSVIGSGPSGLTCAADLAKRGYPVTVFEAAPVPGGQLQLTIPKYRLPKDVLAAEIRGIIDRGIELRLDTALGRDITLAGLKEQGYAAVYLAVGAQKSTGLSVLGEDAPGVYPALDFLRDVNANKPARVGRQVVVIGGGNVAMDAARTARRLGAEQVSVLYRRTEAEMPARREEIDDAEEEGIEFCFLLNPRTFLRDAKGQLRAVECTEMELGEPDGSGRRRPVPTSRTVTIECDTAVVAIGQAVDLSFLEARTGVKLKPDGCIQADPVTLATGEPGVFAGGDGVTGPKSAVEAIHHGHEAAVSIERYLTGSDVAANRQPPREEPAPLPDGEHDKRPRVDARKLPVELRTTCFAEVEYGYTEEEARRESSRCLNCGLCSECLQCQEVCQARAVNHGMEEERLRLNVGSVILAPGYESFDAAVKGEYGYGHLPNVVTSLEFERILSASGPFQGTVMRPSDGKHPKRIAWIQCVGSRDETCGRDYCSSVCCMYATKEAIIAREHDADIRPTIFFNDLRAFGKGFERYFESARDQFGVTYIKGIPSAVRELQPDRNLLLEHTDDNGKKVESEFDMVVLSVGIQPSPGTAGLAVRLGVELDDYGFCKTREFSPNCTSRPGIYVAGAFDAPMDIPESVMSASSAACLASQSIAAARGTLETQKTYPDEVDIAGREPRIGVFVCRCGANIARIVDVPGLAHYAADLPNVVHAEENLYTCSTDTQNKIINTIREKDLNRVVVASCSPRTHEPLFQETIREAGLNRYLFEMANIRDQCSWVHAGDKDGADRKARDLVAMAVARAATLEPLHESLAGIRHRGLVIGGGVAGMTAALGLADQGFEAVLVEREPELGGNIRHISRLEDESDPQELFNDLNNRLARHSMVRVLTSASMTRFSGYLGNYEADITTADGRTETIEHGVVIVATGGREYQPEEYLYGASPGVLTQSDLEEVLERDFPRVRGLKSVVMVQCVGSREEGHRYCSRICCSQAIKNAVRLKETSPDTDVYVLYRDIRTYGMHELQYKKARKLGVIFINYSADRKPDIIEENGRLNVAVYNLALGTNVVLQPDMVVLSAAVRPDADAEKLANLLKLPLTADGFFMEAHMKLRPLDFINEGMYLCGLAHSPKTVSESIIQAQGAVSRAVTVLSKSHLMAGGVVSVVNQEQCIGCLTCVRSCPFGVPRINGDGVAEIEAAACQGCGICAGACPRKAISLQHYKDEQIIAKIKALSGQVPDKVNI